MGAQCMADKGIPRTVWVLGFVSLFMDVSSEMIHALLPVLLVGGLGVSALALGVIEGLAEAVAQIVKVFSGALSDWLGKRKMLALAGYGLAAAVKPLFPLATTASAVLVARVTDRVGKGIRGAPRDAMVADVTPPELRGAAFGLRQSLDTVGAFAGPLLAVALMSIYALDVRSVLWVACIPALIAVLLLALSIDEQERKPPKPRKWLDLSLARQLGGATWRVMAVAALFTLARFSEAFLVLKFMELQFATAFIPLVLVVMSADYSLTSYPVGVLSDRIGRRGLMLAGLAILIAADAFLGFSVTLWPAFVGLVLWGVHMGFTQGLLTAMVADAAPAELRGTAFGVFGLVSGVMTLIASVLAGFLWQTQGSAATFLAGGVFTILAILGFILLRD